MLYLADGQRMSVYQAEPGSRDHDALTLLSMIASGVKPGNAAWQQQLPDNAIEADGNIRRICATRRDNPTGPHEILIRRSARTHGREAAYAP